MSAHSGEWQHPRRPPVGQYLVTLQWTGDDLGPEHVVWLIEHQLSTLHVTQAAVVRIRRVGEDRRRAEDLPREGGRHGQHQ